MMTTVNRSARAVQTLADVDPRFSELVELVYGDAVDPEIVWQDTFGKMSPDQSDLGTRDSSNLARRAAFAGTVAGGVLGVKELGHELPRLGGRIGSMAAGATQRSGQAYQRLVPTGVRRALASPQGRVGVAGTALGADVLASSVLGHDDKKNQVGKVDMPAVGDMARGIKNKLTGITGRLIPTAPPDGAQVRPRVNNIGDASKPPAPGTGTATPNTGGAAAGSQSGAAGASGQAPTSGSQATPGPTPGNNPQASAQWQQFGQGVGQAAGSTPGKVLIGTGVAAAALKARAARQQPPNQQPMGVPGYDPYQQYSKRGGSDVVWEGSFSKFDDDKHLAFGWASVVEMNGVPVVDRQGDYIDPDDLEEAAYKYMIESRKGGHMHRRDASDQPVHVSDIVESVVFTPEKIEKMGLPASTPVGWWIGTKIHDDDVWQEVKKGHLGGFSIHGMGRRSEIPMDQLMGY